MDAKKVLNLHKLEWKTLATDLYEVSYIGHFDDNFAHLDKELSRAGLEAIKRSYDKKLNRTQTTYKKVCK